MTPDQLSKSGTEHAHQVALMAWAAVATCHGFLTANMWAFNGEPMHHTPNHAVPCLKWLHAIHNQGHGDAIRGGRARAEGVKAGIADIFLPFPKDNNWAYDNIYPKYHGLYIEMKKSSMRPVKENSKGGVSQEQTEFKNYAIENGYQWKVAYGWAEAAKIIQDYLS